VYGDLIVEAVETLVLYSGEVEFQDDLIKASRPLLVHLAFNLLRTQQSELTILQNDPDEFVQLALDTCDKQKSRIVKTQAAKLLEAMCDNVDGAVSFVTLFSCQSISLALGSGTKLDGSVDSIEALHEYFYQREYLSYKES
jgi:importin-7